jgi:hypothetical protein
MAEWASSRDIPAVSIRTAKGQQGGSDFLTDKDHDADYLHLNPVTGDP